MRNYYGKFADMLKLLEKIRDQVFVCAIYGSPIRIIYQMPRSAHPNAIAMLTRRRANTGEVTHARIYVREEFASPEFRAERQESIRHEIHHLRICEIDLQRDLSPIIGEATAITDDIYSPELLEAYRNVAAQNEVDEEAFVRVADAHVAGYKIRCSRDLIGVINIMTTPRGKFATINIVGCFLLAFATVLWLQFR